MFVGKFLKVRHDVMSEYNKQAVIVVNYMRVETIRLSGPSSPFFCGLPIPNFTKIHVMALELLYAERCINRHGKVGKCSRAIYDCDEKCKCKKLKPNVHSFNFLLNLPLLSIRQVIAIH
jgi:hypothetical protein